METQTQTRKFRVQQGNQWVTKTVTIKPRDAKRRQKKDEPRLRDAKKDT